MGLFLIAFFLFKRVKCTFVFISPIEEQSLPMLLEMGMQNSDYWNNVFISPNVKYIQFLSATSSYSPPFRCKILRKCCTWKTHFGWPLSMVFILLMPLFSLTAYRKPHSWVLIRSLLLEHLTPLIPYHRGVRMVKTLILSLKISFKRIDFFIQIQIQRLTYSFVFVLDCLPRQIRA